jgi:hypothetical protein
MPMATVSRHVAHAPANVLFINSPSLQINPDLAAC